jgi:hypothetical protein
MSKSTIMEKTRVQFDFTSEALDRLDVMKDKTHVKTRAEVIRNALRLFEWFVEEANIDSTVKIVDKDDEIISQVPAKLILNFS